MARPALVAMAVAGLSGVVVPASAAAQDPVVAIVLEDPQGLVRRGLAHAQSIVSDTYRDADVAIVWAPRPVVTADRVLTVTFVTATTAPRGLAPDAFGVAPSPGDGTRGTHAYVFFDRVKSFADEHAVSLGYVLAAAIAHEVGHLLLPPNAHVAEGIMQPGWHPGQFPPKAAGVPGFPPAQARLLRLRARRDR
jgi:hypothetical protein